MPGPKNLLRDEGEPEHASEMAKLRSMAELNNSAISERAKILLMLQDHSVKDVAAAFEVERSHVSRLKARFERGGPSALDGRSARVDGPDSRSRSGRKRAVVPPRIAQEVRRLHRSGESMRLIAKTLRISRRMVQRTIQESTTPRKNSPVE